MLHYPKIHGSRNCPAGRCLAFEKYDGTNLHWNWDRDFGWHAFGTRRDEFNLLPAGIDQFSHAHEHLGQAPGLFLATLAVGLERVFRENENYRGFAGLKVFTEFLGPNSFAGLHRADDPKRLVLFDVWAEGFGMIGPRQFVGDFSHLSAARVVYEGKLTGKFADVIRTGKYGVAEGVVCKGGTGGPDLWMVKIKTYAYLERLKAAFAERWEDYWE
jgi:hypothetical protein